MNPMLSLRNQTLFRQDPLQFYLIFRQALYFTLPLQRDWTLYVTHFFNYDTNMANH